MQYLGGKSRLAKKLSPVLLEHRDGREVYLEPFIGGGSVFAEMAPHFAYVAGSDFCEDLALMWAGLLDGSFDPPDSLTEEEWRALKDAPPSALRAFAGFACSFGGKWFGGYARDPKTGRSYAEVGRRSLLKKLERLEGATAVHADYRDWSPYVHAGCLVYCDPPYAGTTGYSAVAAFDHEEFWDHVRTWTERGAAVFVSEFTAPADFVPVWELARKISVDLDHYKDAVDRLYVHESYLAARALRLAAEVAA